MNLHVHGSGNDPVDVVREARQAEVDLIAITDHQSFEWYDPVAQVAASPGRSLVVLPGIEITANEGCHILAIFPASYSKNQRERFYGWLEIQGTGDTREASKRRTIDIMRKVVDEEAGIIIVPHPFAPKIGLLDSSRKMSTRTECLESGHIALFQVSEVHREKVRYIGHDAQQNWINRFVLASATEADIVESRYCLAPISRTDAHSPAEIGEACSWFRMHDLSVEGLKQVACEPRTRISFTPPSAVTSECILGLAVHDGYCRGQLFRFDDALSCIIGQNHAGKSTILDLIRFALRHEQGIRPDARQDLLRRLNATLGPEGRVELYVLRRGSGYAIKRTFTPTYGSGSDPRIVDCHTDPLFYRYDETVDQLIPEPDFVFPIEVYEQGRIHELRSDIDRQLEMLDEFAALADLKVERADIITRLNESAAALAPLYDEDERLKSALDELPALSGELTAKAVLLPDDEKEKWAHSGNFVGTLEDIIGSLVYTVDNLPDPTSITLSETDDPLSVLFTQKLPALDTLMVVEGEVLAQWREYVRQALKDLEAARVSIVSTVRRLAIASEHQREAWTKAKHDHDLQILDRLRQAGVDSPKELIDRVSELRGKVRNLEEVKRPRLRVVEQHIGELEADRETLLEQLKQIGDDISARRKLKAEELTAALQDQLHVHVEKAGDRGNFVKILSKLTTKATSGGQIKNRDIQLKLVADNILPIDLARAITQGGMLVQPDGEEATLQELCGITANTENVLCGLAKDIRPMNEIATADVADVPRILVRRRGEAMFADLRTGLSPGEQSAAILLLALQTRSAPLILDQPEDELGYSYVVHLVVPKILEAKFARQIFVVTHNANIPVLGDADIVIKMENHPQPEGDRRCVQSVAGSFESPEVTAALLELEGGAQAFLYRQHRYALPRARS